MIAETTPFTCPVCAGTELADYRGRARARCRGCGAFERSRFLQLVLDNLPLDKISGQVLHLAPEIGIARKLHQALADRYVAGDLNPRVYEGKGFNVKRIDLCRDLHQMEAASLGCIVHVHVLEHVRCNASQVLAHIGRLIRPGGYHVIGLPFMKGYYREDQDPNMTPDRRLELFGHEDHVRLFGTEDFDAMFGSVLREGFEELDVRLLIDGEKLRLASIPLHALSGRSAHSIRVFRKQ